MNGVPWNRDLEASIAAGEFRRDFYHRIARALVQLPPLRDRPEEIPFHLVRWAKKKGSQRPVSAELVDAALGYGWPGNQESSSTGPSNDTSPVADSANGSDSLPAQDSAGNETETGARECMAGVFVTDGCPCLKDCQGNCFYAGEGATCTITYDCNAGGNVLECICIHDTSFEPPLPYHWGTKQVLDCPVDGG